MKIALINPGYMPIPPDSWGAVEKIIWYYKLELEKKGHDVHVRYINEIETGQYDIVHVHMWNHGIEMYQKGIPYVFTCHDHHTYIYGKNSPAYANNMEAMKYAKLAIVPAKYLVEYFDNVPVYLRHGINPEEFYPGETPKNIKLLAVGNNGIMEDVAFDRKGFRYAVNAAERLNLPITIVGPTNDNRRFFDYHKDLLKHHVTVKYDLTEKELQDVYRSHSILIHVTSVEAGHPPLTILEAASTGLPVITTDCAGELFTKTVIRDTDDVVKKLSEVIESYESNRKKTLDSVTHFYWSNVIDDLVGLYNSVINTRTMTTSIMEIYNSFSSTNKNPKIQVIHLLTDVTHEREKRSISYISKLSQYGFNYKQQINEIYDKLPPYEFCNRPHHIGDKPGSFGDGYGVLTGRHYGCYLAHINAIKAIDENYDYTIIFEADANIETSYEEFVSMIYDMCEKSLAYDFCSISLSDNFGPNNRVIDDKVSAGEIQNLAHAYMIPNRKKRWFLDRINDTPWDVFDIWMNEVFIKHQNKRFTTRKNYSSQIEGLSLLDSVSKWDKDKRHYNYIEIGTSDFDTLLETMPDSFVGISIEPVNEYLNKLEDKPNNTKLNIAISDYDGVSTLYYVEPEIISTNNFPEWMRGCNSIDRKHPSVSKFLEERGLSHLYSSKNIETLSFQTFVSKYGIESVDFLKIDTEGNDFIILKDMLKSKIRPLKIQFEGNSLYTESDILEIISIMSNNGYHLTQRTANDITMSLINEKYRQTKKPVLIISTGRRLDYLTKTIRSLFDKNPDFQNQIEKVWVLDDRSSHVDRLHMEKLMSSYFGDNYNTIHFNKNEPYYFVNKFNHIKHLVDTEDIVFLLEDDWECHDNLRIEYHVNNLIDSDLTQIAFADPLDIQENKTIRQNIIDFDYWKNPYPDYFRHPHKWDGDVCYWNGVYINNWTNNPSLIKGEVFHRLDFYVGKNFEGIFADTMGGKQVFTNECLFRHFGDNSLINLL